MAKFDIGIYGLWYGNNYGSIITYYALSKVLDELGFTYAMIRNPLGREIDIDSLERSHPLKFARERYQITKLRPLNRLHELNELFNGFLIGSDQMWNYHLSRPYQQSYFLDFADDKKIKAAYATSFGKDRYIGPDEEKPVTQRNLQRFDAISVRDDFSKRICEKDFNVPAEIVLDPVFLCPVEKYEELIAEAADLKIDEEYIFAYILDPNPQIGASIQKIAQDSGKKVIVVFNQSGDKEKLRSALQITDEKVSFLLDPTVKEWLYLFKNACFVLTDSFHGSCFSIIFRKPFIVMKNNGRGGSRFPFLLGNFGLLDRMVETPNGIYEKFVQTGLECKIDYEKVYSIISKKREESLKWLKNALNGKSDKVSVSRGTNGINTEKNKAVVNTLDMRSCTGCGACENICPVDAITMTENKEGFLNPVLNNEKCVNCGLCSKKCIALNPEYKNVSEPKCFAMMADDDTRFISSSGGMFTVAAEYVLDKGGYVCGAAYTDSFEVGHIIISDKSQLSLLRGSKYMQSHTRHIYKDVKSLLEDGKLVLFTGMPCQVAGLYSYLGKDYENLYSIDLLCHGITSSKVFEKYRKDVLNGKTLNRLEFKAKEPWGWHAGVNAYFTDGTTYSKPLESDMYFIAYLKSIAKNTTCGTCGVNRLPRQGDLTIGDFWGIAKKDPEMFDNKGTSVVLINNEKAQHFFDELKSRMKAYKEESLSDAIMGNQIIKHPYKLHKNREAFFENFDKLDFASLTMGCYNNDLHSRLSQEIAQTVPADEQELYYLAKTAADNAKGRKIITWIHSSEFERILNKHFGLTVSFGLTKRKEAVKENSIRYIDSVKNAASSYYIVGIEAECNAENENLLKQYGFSEIRDYVFRKHNPIVLDNYDCSKGNYSDIYGNTIEGFNTVIGRVVFRGGNNHIVIGKETNGINLEFDLTSNSSIHIGSKCRFTAKNRFQTKGYNGYSDIHIMEQCRFTDAFFRLYNNEHTSSIFINPLCTFETNNKFHANSGKKIIIGRDCMFSHDIDLWAGDGHSIFDVKTGKNINSDYDKLPDYRNQIVIGEHVWVAKGAFIMHGTSIEDGSIVGAKSVVKGKFPNNCSIAGNPASVIKTDIAWSRGMVTTNIASCGEKYVKLTNTLKELPVDKSSKKILILGGTGRMSSELTSLCIANGNDVTISIRGKHEIRDDFKNSVKILYFNRLNKEETIKNLQNKYYDIVFDCSALFPQCVDWVLSCIKTKRYIYVSSFETYAHYHNGQNLKEDDLIIYNKNFEELVNYGEKYWYQRGKYNSELMIANKYSDVNYAIVRIPFVMSLDDDFEDELASRVQKYVNAVVNEYPINNRGLQRQYSFVENKDEANFLYFLSGNDYKGVVNFASQGSISMQEIIQYVESKTGKKALYDSNAELFPFTNHPEVTMNLEKCKSLGYIPQNINDWMLKKVDRYIEICNNQKKTINEDKIKNWFLTSCESDFDYQLTLKLQSLGYNVSVGYNDAVELYKLPSNITRVPLDVKNFESCKKAVETAIEKMGGIDVLVNNAGVSHISTFEETPENIADNIIETNYWGTANMIKAVLPYMHANRNGTVINISSASGFRPRNYGSYYVASKFAVENLTKNLKFECQRFMRFMSVEIGEMNIGLNKRQTVIHTKFQTYKNLPPIHPFKKGYSNNIAKIVNAIINVTSYKELPRDLILGWDAYQQLPQAIKHIENEAEQYRVISITTDEEKIHQINLEDITKPRNNALKIQNWLITGASGGFGKILALRLKNLGYTVAVTSRDISRLESFPEDFIKIESSLESADECDRVIKKAIEKMGSVDVLVNNATSNCWCSFEECPYDIMRQVFYVNYTLPQYMIKAVLPHMRENKNGTVVNITSIAGMQPRARVSTYSAAKAGLEGLTRVLKSECRNFARFMAVELVCMRTGIMIHNPVYDSKNPDYQQLGRYSQEINNIPNRKDIAAQQIINVVNQDTLPQSLPIGTESYLIIKNEIQRVTKDFEDYKDVTLSVCDKTELK